MMHRALWFAGLMVLMSASGAAASEVRGVVLAHLHRGDVGYGSADCRAELEKIAQLGASWVQLNEFAYMERVDSPSLRFSRDRTLSRDGQLQTVRDAHAVGLKVILKPHIWSRDFGRSGKWAGDIRMTSEADWQQWFASYTEHIVEVAKLARESGADAIAIGCELEGTSHRTDDWRKLIAAVRREYAGPITYAANFTEYERVEWWDAVDVIGINAYFPLADRELADEQTLRENWRAIHRKLEAFSTRHSRPVCFLEVGYSPSPRAAIEPWAYGVPSVDVAYQALLYRVALEEARDQPYLKGLFIWKWFSSERFRRFEGRDPFAMQDRAEVVDAIRSVWAGSVGR